MTAQGMESSSSPRDAYYRDETVTLLLGDALDVLSGLPDQSANCMVTSPPYYGLRDYGTEGQYGLEATPTAYVETMRALFAEARRVLSDDGTLWLNLGDSYAGSWGAQGRDGSKHAGKQANVVAAGSYATNHSRTTGGCASVTTAPQTAGS